MYKRMKTAVVGSGAISDIYLTNMRDRFPVLEVVACCAAHLESAQKKAEQYHIKGCTYEEILEDESIELIVNLTPAPAHYEIIKRALLAGKHVYTEKTMTVELSHARELCRLAQEKGLYLCAAPDTFLGAALQTARKAIDQGLIGEVTSFVAYANRDLNVLAAFAAFLRMPGGGICFDYGVYYLTALVSLLGPVAKVCGMVRTPYPERINAFPDSPEYGQPFACPTESQVSAAIGLASGVTGTFHLNGDSNMADRTGFEILGTKGILRLCNPNGFGGEVLFLENSTGFERPKEPVSLKNEFDYADNSRGIGPAEMALAIREGRKARTDKSLSYHVMEVLCGIMESSQKECFVKIESSCERPAPMPEKV